MKRLRIGIVLSFARTVAAVLVVLSLAVSVVLPKIARPDTQAWKSESRITGGGQWVTLPARDDVRHTSLFVYNQTTSSCL